MTGLVVVIAGAGGGGAQASAGARHGRSGAHPGSVAPIRLPAASVAATRPALTGARSGTCRAVGAQTGYVNPTAHAKLTSERIDQGVDYAGKGALTALGPGRITYVGTSATGWPGAFVEYRLLAGPDAGCFVYYAEGITPATGLRRGQVVRAGETLARIIPGWSTGIELGWGAGRNTKTEAAMTGRWSPTDDADNVASSAGRSFSALIQALGGPAGRVEG